MAIENRGELARVHRTSRSFRSYFERLPWRSLGRWWIVGLVFYVCGIATLYVFVQWLRMGLLLGTLLAAEITLVVRFLINDRWVFNHSRPTWRRLWQYHVASAGGGTVWWIVTNVLPKFGIHYLIAATAGTACSVFFGMTTNFLWIWRKRTKSRSFIHEEEGQATKNELAQNFTCAPEDYCSTQ